MSHFIDIMLIYYEFNLKKRVKMANIEVKYFKDINLSDTFFDSLKSDYSEFEEWFKKKARENKMAFTLYENSNLMAFLYLKIEDEIDETIIPRLEIKNRLNL